MAKVDMLGRGDVCCSEKSLHEKPWPGQCRSVSRIFVRSLGNGVRKKLCPRSQEPLNAFSLKKGLFSRGFSRGKAAH